MTSFNHIFSEMPLVFFTIFAQAVVGLSLVYAPAFINGYKNNANLKSFGLCLTLAMFVAFIPSFFHLNDITHIFNVLNRMGVFYANNEWHIGWMNNEILFLGLFCILSFLLYFKTNTFLFFFVLLSGILGLFFMSGAYGAMQESVPTWDFKITLLYFFASAIFLGAIVYYCFFENGEHERKMSFFAGLIGIGLLSTAIVLQTLHVGQTWIMGLVNPFELLSGAYIWFISLSFFFLGLSIVTWYLHNYLQEKFKSKFFAYFALFSAFLGVFITRMLFYGLINTQIMLGQF
ncbi:dimethyl sulfoxide reductase anchor subunit family protein [Campylobacter canadensis]|uniref:Dimethyl sulfoxide reductase anchor subunit n=1 Tax=Campylobacter canadensis TaxID=449520 RepID=A0ABS7WPY0_9BACT|nr:DmsC/YnfH family molybdoenzyme membrane anchor subunit [Campylobacter canadensis]MBZ7986815.1 dimethyl sulfoxide reductase anchor subunit [Campylobacter canadensis]MBZ7995127.1 dimethyl sulfoxide reductase anchor subunit [Campylobacter canadensis]MBZ7996591.1 dimethyl sulfoxide reductase anchor subunit [Campylobacter canadensis]MBZ7997852.1 dimethyl sulfoxide reductase anchor subunit [Campylobacter canadensis]MBZ8000496.1 dimethyl sulfoxide reductase anchor subunit [Campylobacter canadensis